MKTTVFLTTSLLVVGTSVSTAAVSFFDDFSTGQTVGSATSSGFFMDTQNWGESDGVIGTGTAFRDFLGGAATANFVPVGGTGFTPGVNSLGFFYRGVGTRGTDTSLTVSGVNYSRVLGTTGQQNSLLLQVYSLPATSTFSFAEFGNDVASALGVNLVGSLTVAAPAANSGATVPFSQDFDISSIGASDQIYLRFTAGATGLPAFFDNISAQSVPEPSSILLGSVGLLGLFARRRQA